MKHRIAIMALLAAFAASAFAGQPAGWFLSGGKPASYEIGEDGTDTAGGKAAHFIRYKGGDAGDFGTLMQMVSPKNYAGKRVRFQAMVRTRDVGNWAGLWMKADTPARRSAAFYNSQDKPVTGSSDWVQRSVTLDVPPETTTLSFGVIQAGTGQVWLDRVSLEVVGDDVPVDVQPGRAPLPLAPSL
jgi:hypothetical protein